MAAIKWISTTIVSLMTTELNSLANGSSAIASSGYDNATNLYLYGMFELTVTFGSAPTANSLVNLYLVPALDGTNYADATTGASPLASPSMYVGGFVLRAVTSAQRIALGGPGFPFLVPLPPVPFKAYVINNSGQAFPASGSIVKMTPYWMQVV